MADLQADRKQCREIMDFDDFVVITTVLVKTVAQ